MTQTEFTPETFIAGFPGTYTAEEFFLTDWTQSSSRLDGVYLDPVQQSVSVEVAATEPGETHEIVFGNWKCSTKSGMKFHDLNANGVKDEGEPGLEGWTIYVDSDDDGVLDAGEPSATTELFGTAGDGSSVSMTTTTDVNGNYEFTNLPPGSYTVCEVQMDGYAQFFPTSGADCYQFDVAHGHIHGAFGYSITLESQDVDEGNDFGNVPLEGGTPGYWKVEQHWDSWVPTGFDPSGPQGGSPVGSLLSLGTLLAWRRTATPEGQGGGAEQCFDTPIRCMARITFRMNAMVSCNYSLIRLGGGSGDLLR